jgi:hypothetical protein
VRKIGGNNENLILVSDERGLNWFLGWNKFKIKFLTFNNFLN